MVNQLPKPVAKRKKVKTGCRTCKARHVKCDEGRPACHRCVSTGRVCDGYGIWGGGGGSGGIKPDGQTIVLRTYAEPVKHSVSSHYGKLSSEQEACFRWFRYRTYTKLPLPFITPFWRTLVLQACATEPAILHAVLALGSAHHKETIKEGVRENPLMARDSNHDFMLREYSKSIRSLQPHFSSRDKRSIHVAFVACILFTFFENLLGRYATANAHLHAGLRLLAECYAPADHSTDNLIVASTKQRGSVDEWIIESLTRLHVQAALWGQGLPELYLKLPIFPTDPIPTIFESTNQAACHMDRLIMDTLRLTEQFSASENDKVDSVLHAELRDRQKMLRDRLSLWLSAYNATSPDTDGFSHVDGFYIKILRCYHTMVSIMINVCTWPPRETMYDLCTGDFIKLVEQSIGVWKAHLARPLWQMNMWTADEMPRTVSHSVGDKGWIPPLYFVAIKCRVHRIRVQAIKLLEQTTHKEGIWDAKLAILLAEEIMRIEEGDYFDDFDHDDEFDVGSVPTKSDTTLPALPDHQRLYNIRVGLPEHPLGVLTLEYEQRWENEYGMDIRKRCYDLQVGHWLDATSEPSGHC